MQKSIAVALVCLTVSACSDATTSDPAQQDGPGVSLARGGVNTNGSQFITVDETGVDAPLPGGFCSFRPDASGEYNNFFRSNPNGVRFLKIQDASGALVIAAAGQQTWHGTGRVTVMWPDYPDGLSFEMMMVGDRDATGHAGACKYKIANGVAVEWYIRTK